MTPFWFRCYLLSAIAAPLGGYLGFVEIRQMPGISFYAVPLVLLAMAGGAKLGLFIGYLVGVIIDDAPDIS